MTERKYKPKCPMFSCEKSGKCEYPNNCGDEGYVTARTYKKKNNKDKDAKLIRKENEPKG